MVSPFSRFSWTAALTIERIWAIGISEASEIFMWRITPQWNLAYPPARASDSSEGAA